MARQQTQLVATDAVTLPLSALRLIGDVVCVRLLVALSAQDRRFGTLRGLLPKSSTKTVASRLKALERAGLLTRTLYAEVPPRAVYRLTNKGRELIAIIDGVAEWESSWQP